MAGAETRVEERKGRWKVIGVLVGVGGGGVWERKSFSHGPGCVLGVFCPWPAVALVASWRRGVCVQENGHGALELICTESGEFSQTAYRQLDHKWEQPRWLGVWGCGAGRAMA